MNDLEGVGLEQTKYFVPALKTLHTKFVLIQLKITPFPFPFLFLIWLWRCCFMWLLRVSSACRWSTLMASENVILVECSGTNLKLCYTEPEICFQFCHHLPALLLGFSISLHVCFFCMLGCAWDLASGLQRSSKMFQCWNLYHWLPNHFHYSSNQ